MAVGAATGRPMSALWRDNATARCLSTGLHHESVVMLPLQRNQLHRRIAARFRQMPSMGFLEEVQALMNRGDLTRDMPSMRAVGYRQAWGHLIEEIDETTFIEQGIAATRQLAKRQITWLRRWPDALEVVADTPDQRSRLF